MKNTYTSQEVLNLTRAIEEDFKVELYKIASRHKDSAKEEALKYVESSIESHASTAKEQLKCFKAISNLIDLVDSKKYRQNIDKLLLK